MSYLLDSNVWISLVRQSSAVLAARFRAMAPTADIRVCSVVIAELWYACARSAKPAVNRVAVTALTAPFPSLPFDDAAADRFVSLRRHLESLGQTIGEIQTPTNSPQICHEFREIRKTLKAREAVWLKAFWIPEFIGVWILSGFLWIPGMYGEFIEVSLDIKVFSVPRTFRRANGDNQSATFRDVMMIKGDITNNSLDFFLLVCYRL